MTDKDKPNQKTTTHRSQKKEGLFLSAEGISHNGLYNVSMHSPKTLNDNKASLKETFRKPGIQALIFAVVIVAVSLILMSIL